MITTSDALEIMAVVAACHPRTAPRMDDRDVARATGSVWAELLNEYDFAKPELVAAVKYRAKTCPDAPEIADVIRVARSIRSDHMARAQIEPAREPEHHLGDAKAVPDVAEYPADWDSNQRRQAYWYALRTHAMPCTTAGWEALAKQLKNEQADHVDAVAPAAKPKGFADKIAAARRSLDAEQSNS